MGAAGSLAAMIAARIAAKLGLGVGVWPLATAAFPFIRLAAKQPMASRDGPFKYLSPLPPTNALRLKWLDSLSLPFPARFNLGLWMGASRRAYARVPFLVP